MVCFLPSGFDRLRPMQRSASEDIPKETLIQMIRKLLRSDLELSFLVKLEQQEIEQLIAAIRGRIDASR